MKESVLPHGIFRKEVYMSLGSLPVIVPSRYYAYTDGGARFSMTSAVDFLADNGFDGIDLSLDTVSGIGDGRPSFDDDWRGVLYSFGSRAAARGLTIPTCHLPFYMPSPDDADAMSRFAKSQLLGLDAAAMLKIPCAVIHPIVRHSSQRKRRAWLDENLSYLSPIRERAARLGVTLAIENMAGVPYPYAPDETVYGSRAADVRLLADRLDTGICWDFGHAHLSHLCQSAELATVGDRLRMIHIHDNDGANDRHLIPLAGSIDWDDALRGLRAIDFHSMSWRCLNLELKTSHLPADRPTRDRHAAATIEAARRLMRGM